MDTLVARWLMQFDMPNATEVAKGVELSGTNDMPLIDGLVGQSASFAKLAETQHDFFAIHRICAS